MRDTEGELVDKPCIEIECERARQRALRQSAVGRNAVDGRRRFGQQALELRDKRAKLRQVECRALAQAHSNAGRVAAHNVRRAGICVAHVVVRERQCGGGQARTAAGRRHLQIVIAQQNFWAGSHVRRLDGGAHFERVPLAVLNDELSARTARLEQLRQRAAMRNGRVALLAHHARQRRRPQFDNAKRHIWRADEPQLRLRALDAHVQRKEKRRQRV